MTNACAVSRRTALRSRCHRSSRMALFEGRDGAAGRRSYSRATPDLRSAQPVICNVADPSSAMSLNSKSRNPYRVRPCCPRHPDSHRGCIYYHPLLLTLPYASGEDRGVFWAEFGGEVLPVRKRQAVVPAYAARSCRRSSFQFHGRSSWSWFCGVPAMRPRTSASQACGSTLLSLAVPMSVYIAAARTPPRSEPQNSHDFLPRAIPRSALSAALFERQMRPSSRKRAKRSHRVSI